MQAGVQHYDGEGEDVAGVCQSNTGERSGWASPQFAESLNPAVLQPFLSEHHQTLYATGWNKHANRNHPLPRGSWEGERTGPANSLQLGHVSPSLLGKGADKAVYLTLRQVEREGCWPVTAWGHEDLP